MAPLRPQASREKTICGTPARTPVTLRGPIRAPPARAPRTSTTMASQTPSPMTPTRMAPAKKEKKSASAAAHMKNSSRGWPCRSLSGTASRPLSSTLRNSSCSETGNESTVAAVCGERSLMADSYASIVWSRFKGSPRTAASQLPALSNGTLPFGASMIAVEGGSGRRWASPPPPARGVLEAGDAQLQRGRREHDDLAVADHPQLDALADAVGHQHALEVTGVADGDAVDVQDQVAGTQAGGACGAARDHLDHAHAGALVAG